MSKSYSRVWSPMSCSPKFKLNAGISANGKRILKSVSIRNISSNCLTPGSYQDALNNIIGTIEANSPFMLSTYQVIVDGKYEVYPD